MRTTQAKQPTPDDSRLSQHGVGHRRDVTSVERPVADTPSAGYLAQAQPPDGYRAASRSEAVKALQQHRLVYAAESPDGSWGLVAAIEALLEQGRRTSAFTVRFASGRVRTALDGQFFVEPDSRS